MSQKPANCLFNVPALRYQIAMDEQLEDSSTVSLQLTKSYGDCSLKILLLLITAMWILFALSYQYRYWLQTSNTFLIFKRMPTSLKWENAQAEMNRSVNILTWTPFFEYDLAELLNNKSSPDCIYKCVFTNDRRKLTVTSFSNLSTAGVVLSHVQDMNSTDLPQSRSPEQLFAFYLQESPPHTGDILDYIPSDYFNLTMTYRLDSDIYAGYGFMRPIDNFTSSEEVWRWDEVERIVENKTKSALLFVSNCVTESKRELYTRELARYIEVTEFGRCSKRECDAQCAEQEIAQHHFYLAFENSVCRDYVTEKIFTRMEKIILPIVLKRSIASSLLPNESFIAVDDFDSPATFAAYLQYLQNNKAEYIKYFEWTKVYKKKAYENHTCDLCRLLHKYSKESCITQNIKTWWFNSSTCINDYAAHLLGE